MGYKTGTYGKDEDEVRHKLKRHEHRYSWAAVKSGKPVCLTCGHHKKNREKTWLATGSGNTPST